MEKINYSKIFESLDTFTGLPLIRRGRLWIGRCYIDGAKSNRRDKTVATIKNDKIFLLEQGGDSMDLWEWLIKFGGCSDNREAACKLLNLSPTILSKPIREYKEPPLKYVYPEVLNKTIRKPTDNLFIWLSSLFNEKDVQTIYDKYKVGNLIHKLGIQTIFWYIDKEGNICHDKKMVYNENGHRDKAYGGGRKFKVDFGYRGRCYFGEHLLKDRKEGQRVFVVESEKTALILSLFYPKNIYLATGGANMLHKVEDDWVLLRDYDKAGEMWEGRGKCTAWWEYYPKVEEGWDIADALLWLKFGRC